MRVWVEGVRCGKQTGKGWRKNINISEDDRRVEMLTYAHFIVNKLSYNELKEKLVSYSLSTRGYIRETFENKLMHHMITHEGLIV